MVHNLPRYTMPILGREREIAEVAALMAESRVVTITGAGGIGKTRLAAEVAIILSEQRPGGTWFVDLAPISDGKLIPVTIAKAIGLELIASEEPVEALISALRTAQTLVVLDNCEHLVSAAARVVEALVANCPQVEVLATGREPLGIEGEAVYRLGTLDDRSAMELFAAHAYQADPNFNPSGRNLPLMRDICRRLDGIALAIQLAAASVRVMPLGQLRARLDGRFRLLIAGSRLVMLPRHQTMQALFDWSYDLLDDRQRRVFRKLGIFSGSFSVEAAAPVAGEAERDGIAGVLDALAAKSMLIAEPSGRYRMLESIKQYAVQRLGEAGEEDVAGHAFVEFFYARSQAAAAGFGKGSEDAWIAEYAPDLDNFRAALDRARRKDARLAGAIAANLSDLWEYSNLSDEGLSRSEVILAALPHPNDASALPLLLAIARLALSARVYRRSLEVAERARVVAERDDVLDALAEARRIAGRSRYLLGIEQDKSLTNLRDALEAIRRQDDPFRTARVLRDYASALAQIDADEGRRLLLEALSLAQTLDWPRLASHIGINAAEREFRSGNVAAAIERIGAVIATLRSRRSPVLLAHALTNLTGYLSFNGDYDGAIAAAREAVAIARAHDVQNDCAIPMQGVAVAFAARGDAIRAVRLLGYVDAYYERFGNSRELTEAIVYDRLLELLSGSIDRAGFEAASAAGRKLDDDAAWALAFE